MSRAGKKKPDAVKKRAATNLTLDKSLREWGVAYAEKYRDEYRGSLSELINRLIRAKMEEVDGPTPGGAAGRTNAAYAREIAERNLAALDKQHGSADLATK